MKMNGKYLLDTNIVIALFSEDKEVIEKIRNAREIYIPSIVLGELFYGAYNSSKQKKNLERLEKFRKEIGILECGDETAKIYGEIKYELKKKGRPIPENDIWIGAIAIQYKLTLASKDNHFQHLDNLKTEKW